MREAQFMSRRDNSCGLPQFIDPQKLGTFCVSTSSGSAHATPPSPRGEGSRLRPLRSVKKIFTSHTRIGAVDSFERIVGGVDPDAPSSFARSTSVTKWIHVRSAIHVRKDNSRRSQFMRLCRNSLIRKSLALFACPPHPAPLTLRHLLLEEKARSRNVLCWCERIVGEDGTRGERAIYLCNEVAASSRSADMFLSGAPGMSPLTVRCNNLILSF